MQNFREVFRKFSRIISEHLENNFKKFRIKKRFFHFFDNFFSNTILYNFFKFSSKFPQFFFQRFHKFFLMFLNFLPLFFKFFPKWFEIVFNFFPIFTKMLFNFSSNFFQIFPKFVSCKVLLIFSKFF